MDPQSPSAHTAVWVVILQAVLRALHYVLRLVAPVETQK